MKVVLSIAGSVLLEEDAIAVNLALGHSLEDSIKISKEFITHALITAPSIGRGPGPINHKLGGLHVSKA